MTKRLPFQIEKQFPSGAWECYTLVDMQLITQVYYGYTKQEAIEKFTAYLRSMGVYVCA